MELAATLHKVLWLGSLSSVLAWGIFSVSNPVLPSLLNKTRKKKKTHNYESLLYVFQERYCSKLLKSL